MRRPEIAGRVRPQLEGLAARLTPDNLQRFVPVISGSGGILIGRYGQSDTVQTRGNSLCAGLLVHPDRWDCPLSPRPDGTYALFRANEHQVEILTDTLATRTVWYYQNEDLLIASTSQRAIIALLGDFQFNPGVIAWMLSSGTGGPGPGWDSRINRLEGATSLVLDRHSWRVSMRSEPVIFEPAERSDEEHEAQFAEAMRRAISPLRFDYTRWTMLLSGGVDCRTMLCLLGDIKGMRTLTWGLRNAMRQWNNDARVARDLARHFGLPHQFHVLDASAEPFDVMFQRFVSCGEGGSDHISAYMDGFAIWKMMHESGIQGIIRGDEAFGRETIAGGALEMRRMILPQWSDFVNLPTPAQFDIPDQQIPEPLQRRDQETVATWRDRLQQQFRVPVILGALNDLKLPYVETVSPLEANSIMAEVRRLPDHLRTSKTLFRRIGEKLSPPVRYARYPAIPPMADLLHTPRVAQFLTGELIAAREESLLPRPLLEFALQRIETNGVRQYVQGYWQRTKRALIAHLPTRSRPRPPPTRTMDFNHLALRIAIVCRMQKLLGADAKALQAGTPRSPATAQRTELVAAG